MQGGVKLSQLPVASTVTVDDILLGVQHNETRSFPARLFPGLVEITAPLSGMHVEVPVDNAQRAKVFVTNGSGMEVYVATRRTPTTVVFSTRVDMAGLTAKIFV